MKPELDPSLCLAHIARLIREERIHAELDGDG